MEYKQKRQMIEQLLDHWEDFYLPSPSGVSSGDGESLGMAFVSGMSRYPSVVELARCLELTRRMAPRHYAHLIGFYRAEWKTKTLTKRVRDAAGDYVSKPILSRVHQEDGTWELVPSRVRERVVPRWVEEKLVDRALDFLVGVWDFKVVLELPPALNRKLREMTDHEGTHLTEAA